MINIKRLCATAVEKSIGVLHSNQDSLTHNKVVSSVIVEETGVSSRENS